MRKWKLLKLVMRKQGTISFKIIHGDKFLSYRKTLMLHIHSQMWVMVISKWHFYIQTNKNYLMTFAFLLWYHKKCLFIIVFLVNVKISLCIFIYSSRCTFYQIDYLHLIWFKLCPKKLWNAKMCTQSYQIRIPNNISFKMLYVLQFQEDIKSLSLMNY